MKGTPLINNFTSGEWSPLLRGRSDLEQYGHSAETIKNLLVIPYGGVTKVPGTYFVSEVKDNTKKVRLIPFEFNVTQAYILEFGNLYIRFYMDHGQIGVPYEIATPYLEADLPYLQYVQEADVMYIVHPDYEVRKLSRTAHDNWTLTLLVLQDGPLLSTNTDDTSTITPSADTGAGITLTATDDIFNVNMIGHFVWRVKDGFIKPCGYTDTKHITADVLYGGNLGTGPGATDDWAEAAWSYYRGFPAAITLFEQRLCFGYSTHQPQTIWCSVSGEYEVMTLGSNASDAMAYTLASNQVNVIRWLFGDVVLFAGTSGGIFNISSGDSSLALTPTNVVVRRHTNFGCNTIPPVKMGNYLYYIQRDNIKLREYVYEYGNDIYLASDVTLLAEHILKPEITSIAYQQSPYNLLYCVTSEGEVGIFTRNLIQKVLGWSKISGSGKVESVAVIPRATGGDEVWFVFNRTIGSVTKRYIEYMKDFEFGLQEEAFFVRSGLSYSGAPVTTVSGLIHLEGEEVAILGDGAVFPLQKVVDEKITISKACSKIHVGLPYEAKLILPKLEFGSILGTVQGKIQRISQLAIRFYKSLGCSFGAGNKVDVLPFRSTSMGMDAPPDLYTGEKIMAFPGGYSRDIKITIYQDQPLPLTVLALVAFGETYET